MNQNPNQPGPSQPGQPQPGQPQPGGAPFQPQGPGAYGTGTGPAPGPAARPVVRNNPLAIGALVAAVIGSIFAVWEGFYIVGWVLLPISFILALVALLQKDRAKKLAVVALVLSILGSAAGGIAFAASAARAFDEAFTGGNVTATPAPGQPADTAGDQGATASDQGTRENPYPLKSTLANDDWKVTINSFTPDATKKVLAANTFNDKPKAGHTYALVNVTLTYIGEDSGTSMEIGVAYVTKAGNVINSFDTSAVAPEGLGLDEVYTGASVTGNIALEIPKENDGLIRIRPGMFADEVFVATK